MLRYDKGTSFAFLSLLSGKKKKIEGEGAGSSGKQACTCQHRRLRDAPQHPGTPVPMPGSGAAWHGGAEHRMGLSTE